MKLDDVLARIAHTEARILAKEEDPDGDGWIVYIGRKNEMVFPFAVAHCIPIHVDTLENPELHQRVADAVLRRFTQKKKPTRAR